MGKKRIIKKSEEELLKESEEVGAVKKGKGKAKRKGVESGCIYISASYNNTMITLTDKKGGVLSWASAGNLGFKGGING